MFATVLRLPAFRVLSLLTLLVLFLVLAGCALNPIARAQTPEQKYDAVLLTYDAALEVALDVLEDPSVPTNLRTSLRASIIASGELYAAGVATFADFKAARAALAAGGPGAQLDVATENLGKWVDDLEAAIGRLQALSDR